ALPILEIRSALYGAFSLGKSGMVDVTDKVAPQVKDGRLRVKAANDLGGDPAANVVKEMRVEYECGGKKNLVTVLENNILELPARGETGPVRVVRAVYGHFNENLKGLPPIKSVDVTEQLASRIQDQMLTARADNELAGGDPAYMVPKELRVDYTLDGLA